MKWFTTLFFLSLFSASVYFAVSKPKTDDTEFSDEKYSEELSSTEKGYVPEKKSLKYAMDKYVKVEDAKKVIKKLDPIQSTKEEFIANLEKTAINAPEEALLAIKKRINSNAVTTTEERSLLLGFTLRLNNPEQVAQFAFDELSKTETIDNMQSNEEVKNYIYRANMVYLKSVTGQTEALKGTQDLMQIYSHKPDIQVMIANQYLWEHPESQEQIRNSITNKELQELITAPPFKRSPAEQNGE